MTEERLGADTLLVLFRRAGILSGLDEAVLTDLLPLFTSRSVAGGEAVVTQGGPSDALYVVVSGRLMVVAEGADGRRTNLGELGPGQSFGEMGLISGEPRTASVVAMRDSLLARLSSAAFDDVLTRFPREVMTHFVTPIIARLRGGPAAQDLPPRLCIAISPARPDIAIDAFGARLTTALGHLGSSAVIDRRVAERHLGEGAADTRPGDPRNEAVLLWLNEQERAHDVTVYVTDATETGWTQRCARQADLVMVVGDGRTAFDATATDAARRVRTGPGVRRCWALVHDDDRPRRAAHLMASTGVDRCYHLNGMGDGEMARLARLVTGQGVGLVLSGGGARALAHIGVIAALREAAVPIDAVGAVSGGAIVAGLLALGLPAEEIAKRSKAATKRIDYTLPVHALTTGGNWTASMRELFGDVEIEDLWLPFFCLSTNLSRGGEHEHTRGSLAHAVRSSTAIPALLPPVYEDGDVLVDGGLLNNLPVERMRDRPEIGRVIAIDVGSADPHWEVTPFDYAMSGWTSLLHRVAPWRPHPSVPPLSETLLRSISITNTADHEARDAIDHYLRPPVQGFGLMDFDAIDDLVEAGADYAREAIAEWDVAEGDVADPIT